MICTLKSAKVRSCVEPGPSGKPVVTITASAAASVTAAAKAAMSNALKDNEQINDAVSKVLGGYDWTLVPVPAKYDSFFFFVLLRIIFIALRGVLWRLNSVNIDECPLVTV